MWRHSQDVTETFIKDGHFLREEIWGTAGSNHSRKHFCTIFKRSVASKYHIRWHVQTRNLSAWLRCQTKKTLANKLLSTAWQTMVLLFSLGFSSYKRMCFNRCYPTIVYLIMSFFVNIAWCYSGTVLLLFRLRFTTPSHLNFATLDQKYFTEKLK